MKRRFTSLFLFVLLLQLTSAQSFFKVFDDLNINAYSIEQSADGGYIVGGSSNSGSSVADYIFIGKFDEYGNLVWHNIINAPHVKTFHDNISILTDNSIILTGNDLEKMIAYKFDQNGNQFWNKKFFIYGKPLTAAGLVETDNGELIISALAAQQKEAVFYSIKQNGDLNWRKIIHTGSSARSDLEFTKITDSLYIFGQWWNLLAINSNADSLWQIEYNKNVKVILPTADGNILSAGHILSKLDQQGNEIWRKDLSIYLEDGYVNSEGNFCFITESPRQKTIFDSEGTEISTTAFPIIPTAIAGTYDNNYIVSGYRNSYHTKLILFKPNEFGKIIDLHYPNGGESFSTSIPGSIKWRTFGIDSVDIDISTDNGNSWISIEDNYPSWIDNNYQVVFSYQPSDECLIRISDFENETIRDQSDSVFTLYNYRPYDYIAANQIKMWMGNNGMSAHNPYSDDSGFYWPGGENAEIPAIFTEGVLIGGLINGQPRVHGATYRYGLSPGIINPDGTPADPSDTKYQIYKIKKGWESMPAGELRDKYEFNHNNWPVDAGAPYFDFNEDGEFTPNVDGPAYYGDETLYYVANDMDSSTTEFLYGSPPVGLEFQTTLFARPDEGLEDAVFKKVKVINKSGETFEDVYLSYWTDDDLGNANDDVIGCDTTLNLGFTYNGDNDDRDYYGVNPPAVGHLMIQGPRVPGEPGDSARYGSGWIKGYKNLPITAFHLYIGGSSVYSDPDMGVYNGTNQTYYQMQGRIWNGDPMIDPTSGNPTTFCLYGDPIEGTGWYEGQGWAGGPVPSDRRYLMSSGPFTMAPGDTQEVVYAIYMARGSDNLNSITKLKEKAIELVDFYNGDFITSADEKTNYTPSEFVLYQNYPNPFNPTTKIGLVIPSGVEGLSTLKVYDILGQRNHNLAQQTPPARHLRNRIRRLESAEWGIFLQTRICGEKHH